MAAASATPLAAAATEASSCSATHCVGVDELSGELCAWAHGSLKKGNRFGQLGRGTTSSTAGKAGRARAGERLPVAAVAGVDRFETAAAGGSDETGHTLAVAAPSGEVYAFGCDRWAARDCTQGSSANLPTLPHSLPATRCRTWTLAGVSTEKKSQQALSSHHVGTRMQVAAARPRRCWVWCEPGIRA